MRKILFRGKGDIRFNSGGWIYGVPIKDFEGDWQLCTDCTKTTVLPKTIGEYIGLTDKNGKKIFEGDIIRQINSYDNLEMTGVVRFSKSAQFVISHTYTEKENCYKRGKKKAFAIKTNCEIIGNIYDNPELLEVQN